MGNKLLSPLDDDIFKAIFAGQRNIDNLAAFLRPIVNLPDEEYRRLTIVDPHLRRLFKKDKQGILDVKVLTKSGKVINVEVQVCPLFAIRKRIIYYLSKLIWEQVRQGDEYGRIQQAIIVLICDHEIRDEPGQTEGGGPLDKPALNGLKTGGYLNSFTLRNDITGKVFTNLIKIITIELPKVPKETDKAAVWPWARFFTCKGEEEFDMLAKEYPEVTKVVGELKKLSLGERLRMLSDEREKRRKDRLARERYVREEGIVLGMEKGIALGKEEARKEDLAEAYQEKLEAARKLKAVGLSAEFIAESLKLPLETVECL
jgi:predicted transposase/invertase (TIGR01784 family)